MYAALELDSAMAGSDFPGQSEKNLDTGTNRDNPGKPGMVGKYARSPTHEYQCTWVCTCSEIDSQPIALHFVVVTILITMLIACYVGADPGI